MNNKNKEMRLIVLNESVVYSKCDAIVNAANEELQAGGGVCGAIFKNAGCKELQDECNAIGFCKTGHAVMTNGYKLNAKHIIHAVGPRNKDHNKLKDAFLNSLIIADSNNLKSIALVPISTGIFGFPIKDCAEIAVDTILNFNPKSLETCYMYCFQDEEYKVFSNTLKKYQN